MTEIKPGTLLHRLLKAACAEPLPLAELRERVARRHAMPPMQSSHSAAYRLRRAGWLSAVSAPGRPGRVYLYALTPQAEEELDRLHWEELMRDGYL